MSADKEDYSDAGAPAGSPVDGSVVGADGSEEEGTRSIPQHVLDMISSAASSQEEEQEEACRLLFEVLKRTSPVKTLRKLLEGARAVKRNKKQRRRR